MAVDSANIFILGGGFAGCPSYLSHPCHQRILRRGWRRAFNREGGKVFSGNGVWICPPAISKALGGLCQTNAS